MKRREARENSHRPFVHLHQRPKRRREHQSTDRVSVPVRAVRVELAALVAIRDVQQRKVADTCVRVPTPRTSARASEGRKVRVGVSHPHARSILGTYVKRTGDLHVVGRLHEVRPLDRPIRDKSGTVSALVQESYVRNEDKGVWQVVGWKWMDGAH